MDSENPFYLLQNMNKLEIHQTTFYAILNANKLEIHQTAFYTWRYVMLLWPVPSSP
jgi:hypothetical protein